MDVGQNYVHTEPGEEKVTDTSTATAPAPATSAVVDLEALRKIGQEIVTIDEKLAAAQGNEAAMRQSVIDKNLAAHQADVDSVVTTLVPQLASLQPEVLVGVFYALPEAMQEEFAGPIGEIIDKKVEELVAGVKQDVDPLRAQRKETVDTFKAMEAILKHLGVDTSSVPLPKRSGGRPAGGGSGSGSASKSGKNKENYRYFIDGKPQPPSQNSLSSTAYYSTMGMAGTPDAPARLTTDEFRKLMSEAGVNWGPPGSGADTWEFKLANGKTISARRLDPEADKDIFDKVAEAESKDDGDNDENGSTEASTATATPAPATTA